MPLIKMLEARIAGILNKPSNKSAEQLLKEASRTPHFRYYDIFLSHSFKDAEIIYGIKTILENLNYTVYVDWADDSQLSRENVTKETAQLLKLRMQCCKCLFFARSESSPKSKWMPWELGYFDGKKDRVAVLPINEHNYDTDLYQGQEYLKIYPYITKSPSGKKLLVHDSPFEYMDFDDWINSKL